jgi:hypothetical protein
MASLLSQPNFISLTTYNNFKPKTSLPSSLVVGTSTTRRFRRYVTVSEQATANSPAVRKLYVGNIPRTVSNDELAQIVQEHGAVEKAEVIYLFSNFLLKIWDFDFCMFGLKFVKLGLVRIYFVKLILVIMGLFK